MYIHMYICTYTYMYMYSSTLVVLTLPLTERPSVLVGFKLNVESRDQSAVRLFAVLLTPLNWSILTVILYWRDGGSIVNTLYLYYNKYSVH